LIGDVLGVELSHVVLREIPGLPTEQTGSDNDFENGRIARKLPDKERLILRRAAFRRRSFSFHSFEEELVDGIWQR
jgi:hypothetical protein